MFSSSFDYILRIETMEHDSRLVLPALNVDENTLNKATGNVYSKVSNDQPSFEEILEPLSQLSTSLLQALVDRYALDLELFGYKLDTRTLKASCEIRREDGTLCC